jgi:hypothetical protein
MIPCQQYHYIKGMVTHCFHLPTNLKEAKIKGMMLPVIKK